MNTEHTQDALSLSLMPPLYDKLCCSATPLMVLFAVSVAEYFLDSYTWLIRVAGLAVITGLLWRYMREEGITSFEDYQRERKNVLLVAGYTYAFTVALYCFFVLFATPIVINYAAQGI